MVGVGVIGYGYWGPNIARNVREQRGGDLVAISDLRPQRLADATQRYPGVKTTTRVREVLTNPRVDAVVIATPVSTHYELALEALRAGKHVLVEKPMAMNSAHARHLMEEAARRNLVLAVDHTFVYTGAVRKIRELMASDVGDIYYYDSVRVNLGLFQHDVNVIWDLAVHDLSIMDYVLPMKPVAVSATGIGHVAGRPENIAYLTLFFDGPLIAHVHVNWLAPVKVRRTLIGGSRKMIVYDDLEPSEKVKVYDKGITVNDNGHDQGTPNYQLLVGYRAGDMWAPNLDMTEALTVEIRHFFECIEQGRQPIADGAAGLRLVEILEAATQSLRQRGRAIELQAERRVA
ncbi:MAG: Gfo/Idh/MocA family oxidoreductase [Acidobacteria bacterium]|nr:Gfo/Idh/MocA family oxidoreductase [Acidobacteriota bacterium]